MADEKHTAPPAVTPRPSTSTPNPSNFEKKGGWPLGGGGDTRRPSPNGERRDR